MPAVGFPSPAAVAIAIATEKTSAESSSNSSIIKLNSEELVKDPSVVVKEVGDFG